MLPSTLEDPSPLIIIIEVLGTVEPVEEVASGWTGKDRTTFLIDDVKQDRDHKEDQGDNQVEGTHVVDVERQRWTRRKWRYISLLLLLKFKLKASSPGSLSKSSIHQYRRESASNHYDRLKTKKSCPSIETPLSCRDHSFFQDIPEMYEDLKFLYDKFSLVEGDIFESFSFDWIPLYKKGDS